MLFLFFLAFGILCQSDVDANTYCQQEYGEFSTYHNGYCYELGMEATGPIDAANYCQQNGGFLASIHSEEENSFLDGWYYSLSQQVGGQTPNYGAWIGLEWDVENDEWVWMDGTPNDYTSWMPGQPGEQGYDVDNYVLLNNHNGWDDWPITWGTPYLVPALCKYEMCRNYDGEYIPGFVQCGFDGVEFQGDYQEIDDIDVILEDLENQFVEEANYQLTLLQSAFSDKENAHSHAVASESAYEQAMQARVAAESAYNNARVQEENAHSTLLEAVSALQTAIDAYDSQYATYSEQIEFLNYELYIIHEIRELLGENLDYVPVQTVLEAAEHDPTYSDYVNAYPTLMSSAYSDHRFGGNDEDRAKRGKKRTMKKRAKKRAAKKRTSKKQTKKRTAKKQTKKRTTKKPTIRTPKKQAKRPHMKRAKKRTARRRRH